MTETTHVLGPVGPATTRAYDDDEPSGWLAFAAIAAKSTASSVSCS